MPAAAELINAIYFTNFYQSRPVGLLCAASFMDSLDWNPRTTSRLRKSFAKRRKYLSGGDEREPQGQVRNR